MLVHSGLTETLREMVGVEIIKNFSFASVDFRPSSNGAFVVISGADANEVQERLGEKIQDLSKEHNFPLWIDVGNADGSKHAELS